MLRLTPRDLTLAMLAAALGCGLEPVSEDGRPLPDCTLDVTPELVTVTEPTAIQTLSISLRNRGRPGGRGCDVFGLDVEPNQEAFRLFGGRVERTQVLAGDTLTVDVLALPSALFKKLPDGGDATVIRFIVSDRAAPDRRVLMRIPPPR